MKRRGRSHRLAWLLLLSPVVAGVFWLTAAMASQLPATALFAINVHGVGASNDGAPGVLRPAPLSLSVLDDARVDAQSPNSAPALTPAPSRTPAPTPRPKPTSTSTPTPTRTPNPSPTPTILPSVSPSPSLTPVPTLPVVPPTPGPGIGGLSGQVVDAQTKSPITGAVVTLSNGLVRVTDANGNFAYTLVLSGSYTLTVSALNYATQSQAVIVRAGHTTNVQISLSY